jgi:hypothetical protein
MTARKSGTISEEVQITVKKNTFEFYKNGEN